MKTHIITVATDGSRVNRRFLETTRKYGLLVKLLGEGEKFLGKGWRTRKVWEELNAVPGGTTHVLFVDSYDLAFMAGIEEIEFKFSELGHPWVFGAERVCSPCPEMARLYPSSPTPYKFLNAGVWMGELDYVYGWYRRMSLGNVHDEFHDQSFFSMMSLTFPTSVRIDHYQSLVFNACRAEADCKVGRLNGRVQVKSTGAFPSILHANGRFDLERVF